MKAGIAAAAVFALASCGNSSPSAHGPTASPTITAIPASAAPSDSPSPTAAGFTSQLSCGASVTAVHGLALFEYFGSNVLGILDVSNPLKPTLVCTLGPTQGGRFIQSASKIAFWVADKLGIADLSTGRVVQTDVLPTMPSEGFFSSDGMQFAYRTGDEPAGMSTHVYRRADRRDITLYSQAPLGGHGGPPYGPLDQLIFSPDGKELLDFNEFRPPSSGPPKLMVFRTADQSIAYQLDSAAFGAWSPAGSTLYFFVWGQQGFTGELDSVGPSGQAQPVVTGMNGFFWPRVTPDGAGIVYDTYDTGGLPHLWRFDLATHKATQISTALSTKPVFVTKTAIWTDEEKSCACGPGGASAADGAILSHDTKSGADGAVDTSRTAPGIGAPQPSTAEIADVWY